MNGDCQMSRAFDWNARDRNGYKLTAWDAACSLAIACFIPYWIITRLPSGLIATCVSFALCQTYLLIFPFTPLGMAALLGLGALVMAALRRRTDIATTGTTTTIVMVVAAMNPDTAWQQPMLRLVDSLFGITVGVVCKWSGSYQFSWAERELGFADAASAQIGLGRPDEQLRPGSQGEIK